MQELTGNEGWLRKLARDLVANDEDAGDLVQETYAAAIQLSRSEPVTRKQLDRIIRILARRTEYTTLPTSLPASLTSGEPTPEEAEEREELTLALHLAINELKPSQRRAILLRYREGRTIEEVASAMGTVKRNVYYLLDGARGNLRKRLVERYGRETWIPALFPVLLAPSRRRAGAVPSLLVAAGVAAGVALLTGGALLGRWVQQAGAPQPATTRALVLGGTVVDLDEPRRTGFGRQAAPSVGLAGEPGQASLHDEEAGKTTASSEWEPVSPAVTCLLEVHLSLNGEPFEGQYYVLSRRSSATPGRGDLDGEGGLSQELAPGDYQVKIHSPQRTSGNITFILDVSLQPDQPGLHEFDLATGALRLTSQEDRYVYCTDGAGLDVVAWAPSKHGSCYFPCVPAGAVEIKNEVLGNPEVSAWPTVAIVSVLAGQEARARLPD